MRRKLKDIAFWISTAIVFFFTGLVSLSLYFLLVVHDYVSKSNSLLVGNLIMLLFLLSLLLVQ